MFIFPLKEFFYFYINFDVLQSHLTNIILHHLWLIDNYPKHITPEESTGFIL